MAPPSFERTGILVVRLWIESNARDGFRARITRTLDAEGTEQSTAAAATPQAIYAVVRTWVEAFVAEHGNMSPSPVTESAGAGGPPEPGSASSPTTRAPGCARPAG